MLDQPGASVFAAVGVPGCGAIVILVAGDVQPAAF